jgi:hypothetical protein
MAKPMMTANRIAHPNLRPVFRTLPHWGQREAVELIWLPHSVHFTSAIVSSKEEFGVLLAIATVA